MTGKPSREMAGETENTMYESVKGTKASQKSCFFPGGKIFEIC